METKPEKAVIGGIEYTLLKLGDNDEETRELIAKILKETQASRNKPYYGDLRGLGCCEVSSSSPVDEIQKKL